MLHPRAPSVNVTAALRFANHANINPYLAPLSMRDIGTKVRAGWHWVNRLLPTAHLITAGRLVRRSWSAQLGFVSDRLRESGVKRAIGV
jgi:hypothetical protein